MVVRYQTEAEVDRVFQALADATRRDIIARVTSCEQSVSGLATHYEMSFAGVQKHVAVLERAELVIKQKRGREQLVHVNPEALHRAGELLTAYEQLWRDRTKRIESVLNEGE